MCIFQKYTFCEVLLIVDLTEFFRWFGHTSNFGGLKEGASFSTFPGKNQKISWFVMETAPEKHCYLKKPKKSVFLRTLCRWTSPPEFCRFSGKHVSLYSRKFREKSIFPMLKKHAFSGWFFHQNLRNNLCFWFSFPQKVEKQTCVTHHPHRVCIFAKKQQKFRENIKNQTRIK